MNLNTDDSWADLADELGIDTPATKARNQTPPPLPEPTPEPVSTQGELPFDDLPDAMETEGDTLMEPVLAGEPTVEGDGDKKKKRRRRRRRRSNADGSEATGAATSEGDDEGDDDSDSVPPEFAPAAVTPSVAVATDDDEEEDGTEDNEIMDEPTPDAVRELITTWNVPSWQQIVSGLYRPGER